MRDSRFLPALASAVLFFLSTPSLQAQTKYFVVPAAYAKTEAKSRNTYPFSYDEARTQMIYDGKKLGFSRGVITEVAFRRDGTYGGIFKAKKLPLQVWISRSPHTDKSASVCFAQNRGPKPQLVFSGKLSLPQAPAPATPPAPFKVVIPFSKPWIHLGGNICLEFASPGPKLYGKWMTDTYYNAEGGSGTKQKFGLACVPASGRTPRMNIPSYRLLLGKTTSLSLYAYRNSAPCFAFLGISKTSWGGVALPFDLTPFGAKGCKIYTDGAVVLTATSHPTYASGTAKFCFFVPNDPSYLGKKIYTQGFVVDPQANALGLLSSEAWEITFGTTSANYEGVQAVFAPNLSVQVGSTSTGANGHITRFGGNLN